MLEFLGRVVVESFMERRWVHLLEQLAKSYDIIDFCLVLLRRCCRDRREKGEEEGSG